MTGVVFDIKEFAVFDGPGIRTTVFMKGCPLRCRWCHNPEGLSPRPQLMVSRAACTHCGACEAVCPHPDGCVACGACIAACRGGYRRIVGQTWSADDLAARLHKDADVYALSGGGVTFSGGEPLMQWNFVRAVLDRLHGVHTAIETSGFASDAVFEDAMARLDLIMLDWKVSDPAAHRRYTGVDQEIIFRHARMLAAGDTPFILRMPIIPGVNDNPAHFETAASLVRDAKALVRIDVLPYQRAAGAKYEMVSMDYQPDFDESRDPQFFTQVFARERIPFQVFR
ncbi:MAG: glycyl-radical enzyme activating protein [Clostridiales bacterium]|nr:glycyl-radical enzyme activating protein [Clostridiales bacterium]